MKKTAHLFWDEEWNKQANSKRKRPVKKGQGSRVWDPFLDCDHWRERFDLEGGLSVFASAWMDRPNPPSHLDRGGFKGYPDIGLYLDPRWGADHLLVTPGMSAPFAGRKPAATQMVVFPWPDYGVPTDQRALLRVLKWITRQLRKGKVVDIGCMGGHGRTGSALCALLLLQGVSLDAAVRRVRKCYCAEAIESERQLQLLVSVARKVKG